MMRMAPGGRIDASNVTLKILVEQAYGVRDFQISGGPSWVNTERFDVSAKADGQTTPEAMQAMMRSLLKDRFKLEIHKDTKELPMYTLTVAKSGPKMKAGTAPPPPPDAPPGAGRPNGPMIRMGRGLIEAQNMPMSMLATTLGRQLGRSVEDKTGLPGTYDVKLEWTPDETQGGGMRELGGDRAAPVDATGPTIFAALQEQLGLKLESQKGPVEIVVIDRVEKPSEN